MECLKKLWNFVTGSTPTVPSDRQIIFNIEHREESPEPKDQDGIVAFIIGHNAQHQGAVNYLHETEYSFSSRILRKAQKKLRERGYISYLVTRPAFKNYKTQVEFSAKMCKEQGVTHAVESHFNSSSRSARGCEFLVPFSPSPIDNKMADYATDLLNERLSIKERRMDGVYEVEREHSGAGMLYELNKIGIHSTIAEPVFANIRSEESAAVFENEDAYVEILVDLAEACCNGTIANYAN